VQKFLSKPLEIKIIVVPLLPGCRKNPNGRGRFLEAKTTDMEMLKYTTREINHNYKIKVAGTYDGKKVNTLVGVSGLLKMVNDIELTNRLLDRAFACMEDVCVCKLRRGIKISFYVA
jgi:hypothetical protein